MRVHFCGVRGSTPAPGADFLRYGGHTSCIAIAHDGATAPTLILDAGTGIRTVPQLLGDRPYEGTIVFSHLHWDHVQGMPFFSAGDRDEALLTVLVPEQEDGADAASVLARAMSPPHFPLGPHGLRGSWTFATIAAGESQLEGFTVLAREIPHKGGRTYGYRVSDARSTLTYIPDHCPTLLGPGVDGVGEYHEAALELCANADVLVHDSHMHTRQELAAEGRYGHACADYPVELARRARALSVVLFHHRPDRTDDALDELARRFEDTPTVSLAVQGAVWEPQAPSEPRARSSVTSRGPGAGRGEPARRTPPPA